MNLRFKPGTLRLKPLSIQLNTKKYRILKYHYNRFGIFCNLNIFHHYETHIFTQEVKTDWMMVLDVDSVPQFDSIRPLHDFLNSKEATTCKK